MFDAVIFDVGGVLTTSPSPIMAKHAQDAGIDPRTFGGIVLGPLDVDTDHPWHRAERGEISFDETVAGLQLLAAEHGLSSFPAPPSGAEIVAAMQPIQPMIEFAREVRTRGLGVGIITNNIKAWGRWRDLVGADEIADVVIDSCEVGMRKPDPAIYQLALAQLGVRDPARALFLDDFTWNVTGASAIGLSAIHVSDHDAAIVESRRRLGWT